MYTNASRSYVLLFSWFVWLITICLNICINFPAHYYLNSVDIYLFKSQKFQWIYQIHFKTINSKAKLSMPSFSIGISLLSFVGIKKLYILPFSQMIFLTNLEFCEKLFWRKTDLNMVSDILQKCVMAHWKAYYK